jgi:hypothetical protein
VADLNRAMKNLNTKKVILFKEDVRLAEELTELADIEIV